MTRRAAIVVMLAAAGVAHAQPAKPAQADAASCLAIDTTPGAPMTPAPAPGQLAAPIPWTEFVVEGHLADPPELVHELLAPTLDHYRTNLTAKTLVDISKVAAKFGYQLVDDKTRETPSGPQLVLHLETLPIVRLVDVDIPKQGLFDKLLDEEVRRRMQLRTGSYLPADPIRRQCALVEERQRIEDFLHDEGYFDAKADIKPTLEGKDGATLNVVVDLGAVYKICKIDLLASERLAIDAGEIKAIFKHGDHWYEFGKDRFTRTQHQEDLQKVRELFHKRGYPMARVQSSFNDPEGARTSFDRRTKCVNLRLTIDQRRNVDIRFDGNDRESVTDEALRSKLTFDQAGSVDDVEAQNSARAIVDYLQSRGNFDARVTYTRTQQQQPELEIITFHIEQGKGRQVQGVEFVGNIKDPKNPLFKELSDAALGDIIATKPYDFAKDVLGTTRNATSELLAADVDRIREYYRRIGYREAEVDVSASPGCPVSGDKTGIKADCALDDPALIAPLVATGDGDDLYVRFTIVPGPRTELVAVELEPGDAEASRELGDGLCRMMLGELANELRDQDPSASGFARRVDANRCNAVAKGVPFREDFVAGTKDRLRDFLFKQARPRADLDYEVRVVGPHAVEAHFKVQTIEQRRVGKVVIRGAFRTEPSIIRGELQLREGQLLTSDALADAARRLRNTGLFDAVNIDLPDISNESQEVNMIVRVEERYWYAAALEVGTGYSSYNGLFGTVGATASNLFHRGASLQIQATYGQKITDLEATFRLPQYLIRRWVPHNLEFQTELKGLYLVQDTPRFGLLTTEGASLGLTRVVSRPKTLSRKKAYTMSFGVHYDYRLRTRNVDALRPIGADMDDTQVAIETTTGSVGVTGDLDGRVDRSGQLSPLAPSDGYHLGATVSYASPYLLGQDTFIKVSATGSLFRPWGDNLVLRADLRYDQGFPLGGAVLLPDVERFFAGGDNTVRGYQDDRLATEIIQTGVPPLSGVSQIRVIPAGGNIRTLGSLDAQYRIWKVFAGALFTDAGMITNQWSTVTLDDIRPSVGAGLRVISPFGIGAVEYAVPIRPHLGDDPRGRIHFYFAARAQF
ncbi:MAG: BamA/TamA family outer membrane protein [Acidobacteriota bacterium]